MQLRGFLLIKKCSICFDNIVLTIIIGYNILTLVVIFMTHEFTHHHSRKLESYAIPENSHLNEIFGKDISYFGGASALLSQIAHKSICAGVADHSEISIKRLQNTRKLIRELMLGSIEDAKNAAAEINDAHKKVRGKTPEGVTYKANDSDLVEWVWATLMYTGLAVHEWCVKPLTIGVKDGCVKDSIARMKLIGGDPNSFPQDYASLNNYFETQVRGGNIEVTSTTLSIKEQLFNPPEIPFKVTKVFDPLKDKIAWRFMHPSIKNVYYPNLDEKSARFFETTSGVSRAVLHYVY